MHNYFVYYPSNISLIEKEKFVSTTIDDESSAVYLKAKMTGPLLSNSKSIKQFAAVYFTTQQGPKTSDESFLQS